MLSSKIILIEAEWEENGKDMSYTLIKEVINSEHAKQALEDWSNRIKNETPSKEVVGCAYYERQEILL